MGHTWTRVFRLITTKYIKLKMKTFALVLALAAVAAAKPDFEACPGFEDNSYVNPWSLTLNPDPIVAKEGAEVKVHFDAKVLKQLTVGTKVDIKMVKDGLPLPCLPVPALPSTLVPATTMPRTSWP